MKQIRFILLLSVLVGCSNKEEIRTEKSVRPVKYAKITQGSQSSVQSFSGVAQASKEAAVSFKVNGTLSKIYVKVGDQVKRGQLIARMDATDYSVQYDQSVAQLKSAETQIKSAKAQLVNARSTYDRAEKLYENNSVPLSEYQQAQSALEAAASQYDASIAQVEASKAQVASARNQVSYAQLKAPFTGIINAVNAEENEMVAAGNPVALLSAQVKPEVMVGVPEIFIANIQKGRDVEIAFSQPLNKSYAGKVTEVGFSTGGGATYPVTVEIVKPDARLRPGMAADVIFDFGASKTSTSIPLVAPVASVGEGIDGHFVFKLSPKGDGYQAVKQKITIGPLVADGFEVSEGLSEGDLVAVAGLKSLLDGMEIKLLPN